LLHSLARDSVKLSMPEDFDWGSLLAAIQNGNVIPVLGEDLYTDILPDRAGGYYRLLAERLAARLNVDTEILPTSFGIADVLIANPDFASRIMRTPQLPYSIVSEVNESMLADLGNTFPIPEALRKLCQISTFNLFVSLTMDRLLDVAIQKYRGVPATVLANKRETVPDLTATLLNSGQPIVFKLLGQFSPQPEYALTEEDILEFMRCLIVPANRPRKLFYELSQNNLLIIGSHFPDWLTRFFLRATRGSERLRMPRNYTQYVVNPNVSSDVRLASFLQNFSSSTMYAEVDPARFVDELYWRCHRLALVHKTEQSTPPRKPEGPDVFLSYAGEDRAIAIDIRKSLENCELRVWMDSNPNAPLGLEPGAEWDQQIQRMINTSGVFLAVLSENTANKQSPKGRYFRKEWKVAYDRLPEFFGTPRRFVFPVVITGDNPFEPYFGPDQFRPFQPTLARKGILPANFISSLKREIT
jgi:hypothetical protein